MGEQITITAEDAHSLAAYQAGPDGRARGGVIILQEIFGLNSHIREVCDSYAAAGWSALAPALFDRVSPDIQLDYTAEGLAEGRAFKEQVDGFAEADILACRGWFETGVKVAVIGYCWGGSLAWRMACRHQGFAAAIAYYGGELPALKDELPLCPVQAHFGRLDASIPMAGVEAFMAARPEVMSLVHEADHGFNCDHRRQYDAGCAAAARHRVNEFLASHLAS